MSNALDIIWSLPMLIGFVTGAVSMRVYLHLRCRWRNRHHPRPDGQPYTVAPLARQWTGGLIVVAVIVYVLAQGQQTHNDTVALTERTTNCAQSLIEAINDRADLNNRRDTLSEEQRRLGSLVDAETAKLIRNVIAPPPDIASLPPNDERRVQWIIRSQAAYDAAVAPWLERSAAINDEVTQVLDGLAARPLPTPRCFDGGN